MPTINVNNPPGAFGAKGWYLNGSLQIQPQKQTQDNLPISLTVWGERDHFWGPPVRSFSVTGRNFTFAETVNWELLAQKPGDTITCVLADGQSIGPGWLVGFTRTNTEGSGYADPGEGEAAGLYDITLQIELDPVDPEDMASYEEG